MPKFTGKESAIDYEKYATRSATAKDIRSFTNTIGLFSSNPLTTILGTGAKVVENYSDRQITKLMDNVYASQEYQDYMKNLDYEYDAYQDYDVYNDFQGGPNYRDDKGYLDVRPGTVFDAEDEEINFTPPSPPPPAYDFDDSMGDSGSSQDTTASGGPQSMGSAQGGAGGRPY